MPNALIEHASGLECAAAKIRQIAQIIGDSTDVELATIDSRLVGICAPDDILDALLDKGLASPEVCEYCGEVLE